MAKRILVLEDDQDVMDTLKLILLSKGYEVDVAYNGKQGVEKIKQRRPDLIVLDLTMPIMDGWAVLVALKKDPNYSAIPVVIITSSQKAEDIEKAKKFGVESYVVKPFEAQKILRIVRHLMKIPNLKEAKGHSDLMEGDLL